MIDENMRIKEWSISENGKRATLIGYDHLNRRHEMYCRARRAFALNTLDQLFQIRMAVSINPEPLTPLQKQNLVRLIRGKSISEWVEDLQTAQVRMKYYTTDAMTTYFLEHNRWTPKSSKEVV